MLSPVVIRSHPLIRVNLDLVDLAPIWGLFALFGPVGAIFGVGVKFSIFKGDSPSMTPFGTLPANKKLFAGTLPAFKKLFAGTLPAFNKLFAGTLPTYKKLFAGTQEAI